MEWNVILANYENHFAKASRSRDICNSVTLKEASPFCEGVRQPDRGKGLGLGECV